jgi:hypothetical protein
MPDHIHLLVGLHRETSVAEAVKLVKGLGLKWIHETYPDRRSFASGGKGDGVPVADKYTVPFLLDVPLAPRSHLSRLPRVGRAGRWSPCGSRSRRC